MGSTEASAESFEHIMATAARLMSMVSDKARHDLKEYLPDEVTEVTGHARSTIRNVRDASGSLGQLGVLAGQLLVDATARLTTEVAARVLQDPSPAVAHSVPGRLPYELAITASPGTVGSAKLCVYNSGTGVARGIKFSATSLRAFGVEAVAIPAEQVTCQLQSRPRHSLESRAWTSATVTVTVPALAPPGEYLGYLGAMDATGNPVSAGHIAVRVVVVPYAGGDSVAGVQRRPEAAMVDPTSVPDQN